MLKFEWNALRAGDRVLVRRSVTPPAQRARLASDQFDVSVSSHGTPSKRCVLVAVLRRLTPDLIEASVIPTALFTLTFLTIGTVAAYAVALAWTYLAIGRRVYAGRPVPTLVLLASIGITLRTVLALASGSTFVYFAQPVLGKIALSAVLMASIITGRPLVTRFAHDFCRMSPEIDTRPAIVQLYRRLTYLWVLVNLAAAAVTVTLLLTTRASVFVTVKPLAGGTLTALGVALTVSASVRAARSEGLFATVSADGRLSARCRYDD
jgi:hypothetical protein